MRFPPTDVCVLGGRRYVLRQPGGPTDPTISEIDSDGQVIRGFASPEEPRAADQRRELGQTPHMLNYGYLACDEATRTIVKFNWMVPVVRAFDPEGEILWETTLEDYVPWQLTASRPGVCCRYRPDPEEGFSHSGRSVVVDRGGNVVLGLQIEGPRSAENRRHELIVLDVSSGRVISRHPTVGVVGSVSEGLIFTYGEEPFPQVRVFGTAVGIVCTSQSSPDIRALPRSRSTCALHPLWAQGGKRRRGPPPVRVQGALSTHLRRLSTPKADRPQGREWCRSASPRGNGRRGSDRPARLERTERGSAPRPAPGQRGKDVPIIQRLPFDNLRVSPGIPLSRTDFEEPSRCRNSPRSCAHCMKSRA